jgi:O-antigen ligase
VPTRSFTDEAHLVKRLLFDPIVLYFLCFLLIDARKAANRYLFSLLIVFSCLNILSLILRHFGISFFIIQDYSKGIERFAGFLGNPNKTVYLLCVLMPGLFYMVKKTNNIFLKIILSTLIASIPLTIVLSQSRGGAIAFVLTFIALGILLENYRLLIFTGSLAIIFSAFFAQTTFFDNLVERFQPLIMGDFDVGTSGRLYIWSELLKDYGANLNVIFLGAGFGNSEMLGIKADPHNFYLQVLVEFGIIGIIIWFTSLIWVFLFLLRKNRLDIHKLNYCLAASFFAMCLGWFFSSLDGVMSFIALYFGVGISYLQQLYIMIEIEAKEK